MKKLRLISGSFLLSFLILTACGEKEKFDQGRVIDFDKAKRTITLIRDNKADPINPDYTLPAITYYLPKGSLGIEEEIKSGLRINLNTKKNQIVIYDPVTRNFKTLNYTLLDKKEGILMDNPLVFDPDRRKMKEFPIIDRERKMITIYSRRQQILTTFTLPDRYFDLPEYTWKPGDDVRVYCKDWNDKKIKKYYDISRMVLLKLN
jgi:hypothetical protein